MNFLKKSFCIIYKTDNDCAKTLALEITNWLEAHNAVCCQYELKNFPFKRSNNFRFDYSSTFLNDDYSESPVGFLSGLDSINSNSENEKIEEKNFTTCHFQPGCAIILGGDGTILEAARYFAGTKTVIFGINFGRIGFLTASEPEEWQTNFLKAISHPEKIRRCSILKFIIDRKPGIAINELVLSHGAKARLLSFNVKINNEDLGIIRSDGLIFYTPLGSSAYNLSAGGPILYPDLNVLGMTPICPYMTPMQSLVFPFSSIFTINLTQEDQDCHITIDGQLNFPFHSGNSLEITGYYQALNIWLNEKKYLAQLAY